MSTTRRDFIRLSALAGGILGLGVAACGDQPDGAASGPGDASSSTGPLKILVLGGTGFIGPRVVQYALDQGHEVTVFNRGRTNTHLFPGVEKLVGDRDGDLESLRGRDWDGVVDNSGYIARHVRDSAELLRGNVGRYLFTSSIAAYADFSRPGVNEDHNLATIDDPSREDLDGATYGPFKVLCENHVRELHGDGATIVRPGYVVGPGDTSDRWTYWPVRVARGGDMIAPGSPNDPIQIIDVRDLGAFMVRLIENRTPGSFNGVGPEEPIPFGEMLEVAREVSGADPRLTWVDPDFLLEQGLGFPVWGAPEVSAGAPNASLPTRHNVHRVSNRRSVAAGLTYTSVADTTRDTLEWWETLSDERRANTRAFVDAAREAEVLAAWQARG